MELTVAAALLSVGLALGLAAAASGLNATRLAHERERAARAAAQLADSLAGDPAAGSGSRAEHGLLLEWSVRPDGPTRYIEAAAAAESQPQWLLTVATRAAAAP